MKKYIIEVDEIMAKRVANLLTQIEGVKKIINPIEQKKRYVKVEGAYGSNDSFLWLTEEQFRVLEWLSENDYFCGWSEVDPSDMFEEV